MSLALALLLTAFTHRAISRPVKGLAETIGRVSRTRDCLSASGRTGRTKSAFSPADSTK